MIFAFLFISCEKFPTDADTKINFMNENAASLLLDENYYRKVVKNITERY
jgi:hypothetical protein